MFDSGNGPSGCGSGESLVGYIYGEMEESSKAEFENHLADCSSCAEELASFSSLRISIEDWRASERAAETAYKSQEPGAGGFLAKLAEIVSASFGFKALAGAAVALIILLLGLVAFSLLSTKGAGDEIANVQPAEEEPLNAVEETVSEPAEGEIAEATPSVPVEDIESDTVSDKPVEVSPKVTQKRNRTIQRRTTVPQSQLAEISEPPRLSEAAEEEFEDDSLRLTDLFSETSED
ncbi:MAG: zf-HC2 domain-containing protein [Acidobacteriota bacterium]|nr:MAG: zf-HC2 domain-containing protein [Acidobacteriota bacterium]